MQNKSSPEKRPQPRHIVHDRVASSSQSNLDYSLDIKLNQESEDLIRFNKTLKQLIRKYVPKFKLHSRETSYDAILNALESALKAYHRHTFEKLQEKSKEDMESLQLTSLNLSKYEELLEEKSSYIENQIKTWNETRITEEFKLEKEKKKLTKMQVKLENSIAAEKMRESENQATHSKMMEEVMTLQNSALKQQLENESLKWKIDQDLRSLSEKELMLELKHKLLEEDKASIRFQKSEIENERIKNSLLAKEYSRSVSRNSPIKVSQSISSSVIHFDPARSVSSQRDLYSPYPTDTNQHLEPEKTELTLNIHDLSQIKNSLDESKKELEILSTCILPELHSDYETLSALIEEIKQIKINAEEIVENYMKKFDYYQQESEEMLKIGTQLQENIKEVESKEKQLEKLRMELEMQMDEFYKQRQDLAIEIEEFQKEKIEYFDEVANERKRIQEYYLEIEFKLSKLNSSHSDLIILKKSLDEKERTLNSRRYQE